MPSGWSPSRSLGLPKPAEAGQLSVPHPLNTWRPLISHCLSLQVPYRPPGGLVSSCIPGWASCVDTQHHGWVLISYNSHRYKRSLPSHRRTTIPPPPPPPKPPGEGAVVLSSALPPISAKLAQLKSQQYVAMKELLSDNMALHSQLEDLPASPHRLREIESPLSWVFSAVSDALARILLTKCVSSASLLPADGTTRHGGMHPGTAMHSGHMSGVGCPSCYPQNERAKLPADIPGHPDRYYQDGAQPPLDKLARTTVTVFEWRGRKAATKKQLQSLIGTLSHAATVVIPGRTFMRRMIDTMKLPKCQHHIVRLNQDFQLDVQWWACFLPGWNGKSILPPPQVAHTFWSVLGMWSIQSPPKLVPATVAGPLEAAPHSSQRDGPNSNCGGSMGPGVEFFHSPCLLRQHGCCWGSIRGAVSGSSPHAPATMPTLLLCTLQHSIASSAHTGG